MTAKLDYTATQRALVDALDSELRPIHYHEAHDRFGAIDAAGEGLSKKTNRREKLRQRYCEQEIAGLFCFDGYIYREQWFFRLSDLIPHEPLNTGPMPSDVALDAGYDLGRRFDYMIKHYQNQSDEYLERRRKHGHAVEYCVKHYFKSRWPEYIKEPENAKSFKKASSEDFGICVPGQIAVSVDVKSRTEGFETWQARNQKKGHIYLLAELANSKELSADMHGFKHCADDVPGMEELGFSEAHDIRRLIVLLNMARRGVCYADTLSAYSSKRAAA